MKNFSFSKRILLSALALLCVVLLVLSGLWILSRFDNKYSLNSNSTQEHITILPKNGVIYLVNGWELYPDRLLTPADFAGGAALPHYNTWSGEHAGLAPFHADGNPYGVATYRLLLQGEGLVTLYLQEPLCAARVFVNGVDMGGPGQVSVEDYRPLVRDTFYSFDATGETELIIQTANYSHYYGGIWYPPAVGDADSVARLTAGRLTVYGLLCFSTLALALFCAVLWLGERRRDDTVFHFGLLSLAFALRICYPFLRLWGVPSVGLAYALEDFCALLGIYCAVRVALHLFLPEHLPRVKRVVTVLTLGMCGVGVLVPLLLLPVFPSLTPWYGLLLTWYELLGGAVLLALALCGCALGIPHAAPLLAAAGANGACLLWGALTIGRFEPAMGLWPEEYGAFLMVLAFSWLMARRGWALAGENRRLTGRLREEVEEKTHHLTALLTERDKLMSELGHDLKSPLTALSNMAQIIRMGDIMLPDDQRSKLEDIEERCGTLAGRLRSIQELAKQTAAPLRSEPLSLNKFLTDFHRSNQPVIELTGPDFVRKLTPLPCTVLADREKLSRALENLVFNAADFTSPEGRITLTLEREDSWAIISLADDGCGIPAEDLPKVFHRSFTSRPDEGGQGLGLAITRAIILEHRGDITVDSTVGVGTVFTIRLPLAE